MSCLGHFGHYSLYDWWVENFTSEEKNRFKELYKPMGGSYEDLFLGPGGFFGAEGIPNSPVWFLTILADFAQHKSDTQIALRFLTKAEELSDNCSVVDKHSLYQSCIRTHYKLRKEKIHYESAINYCRKQISIALEVRKYFIREFYNDLPGHLGYYQLSIILEKERKFDEAMNICQQALEQGWKGDWIKRIEELSKRNNSTRK